MALWEAPMQALCSQHQLRRALGLGLAALALTLCSPDTITRSAQLRHKPGLLILSEGAGDLAHHDPRGVTDVRQIIAAPLPEPCQPTKIYNRSGTYHLALTAALTFECRRALTQSLHEEIDSK
jgi:hypothetical protein